MPVEYSMLGVLLLLDLLDVGFSPEGYWLGGGGEREGAGIACW